MADAGRPALRTQWMIFCGPADVDETWAVVARATANNELGVAAKVQPGPDPSILDFLPGGGRVDQQERLICVYTADFADVADVKRVAAGLRQLGLVAPRGRGRPLFYKPGQCFSLLYFVFLFFSLVPFQILPIQLSVPPPLFTELMLTTYCYIGMLQTPIRTWASRGGTSGGSRRRSTIPGPCSRKADGSESDPNSGAQKGWGK